MSHHTRTCSRCGAPLDTGVMSYHCAPCTLRFNAMNEGCQRIARVLDAMHAASWTPAVYSGREPLPDEAIDDEAAGLWDDPWPWDGDSRIIRRDAA